MKSAKLGSDTSASVENITPFGVSLPLKGKEYLLGFEEFPCFRDQRVKHVQTVEL